MSTPAATLPAFPQTTDHVAPVSFGERIAAIDAVRGFAVLGILLMNIIAMGIYGAAYDDPTVAGGATGANLAVWAVLHVLAEGKMRALFSIIFGASMILLTDRLDKRPDGADIYYRRTLWLLAFGIAHAYLLWLGDILYPYALCGLALYPFRKMPAKRLLIIGTVILVLLSFSYIGLGKKTQEIIQKGTAAQKAQSAGVALTLDQKDELKEYEEWRQFNKPTEEEIQRNYDKWRGGPLSVIGARGAVVGHFHSFPYYHPWNWDIFGMMFIGMGLMRWGIFAASRPASFYARLAIIGYGIGIPIKVYSAWFIIKHNFDPVMKSYATSTYDIGRITIALAHLAVIVMLCRAPWMNWLTSRLSAVGQMAFSNYLFQSVVTAFFFTGYGLGYMGVLQRHQLYYVVGTIWIFQLIISPIWLRHFRFGPLEWCWRSLTYWKKQPMRLTSPAPAPAA